MYKYLQSKEPRLEVQIVSEYTAADFDRIIFMVDAMIDVPTIKVVFKVRTNLKTQLELHLANTCWLPFVAFNIEEI